MEMTVTAGFLRRLAGGLAIAGPIALFFAAAPMVEVGLRPDSLSPTAGLTAHLSIVPAGLRSGMPNTSSNSLILKRAFAAQTSELIWSQALPLANHGDDTIENVRVAAEALDLIALSPGEVFSFNDIVGIRSEEKGYRPGLMYSNGELVTGIGGGICIVSTLLYNAALETGLKIIERHPHSGPVSYAQPGRDAAVSFGWADLRFKNNTDGLLLIRSRVRQSELVVALYGTKKPGQTVEIVAEDYEEIPCKVVEKEDAAVPEGEVVVEQEGRPGYSVTIVRVIKQNGPPRRITREVISRDIVLPRDRIIRVPPKRMELPFEFPEVVAPFELPSTPEMDMSPGSAGTQSEPGLPLPGASERNPSTSERTTPTASE